LNMRNNHALCNWEKLRNTAAEAVWTRISSHAPRDMGSQRAHDKNNHQDYNNCSCQTVT
jgi:predicted Fe-S protein YdhL (DUF1289 family)